MKREIADRLYTFRKNSGLSQEELAEKIGVSRQAVSKWERGEASPDTENLILLAKTYGVSLDELILSREEPKKTQKNSGARQDETPGKNAGEENRDTEKDSGRPAENPEDSVSFQNGIHVNAKNGDKVNIDGSGIHVENHNGEEVHVDWSEIRINNPARVAEKSVSPLHSFFKHFPYPLLAATAYLAFGCLNICGGWAFGWLILLTIPLYYTAVSALFHRNAMFFAYPVLVAMIYLWCGFTFELWHPLWILFLTIPLYYTAVSAITRRNAMIFTYPVLLVIIYLWCGFAFALWHPLWILFLTIPVYYSLCKMLQTFRAGK